MGTEDDPRQMENRDSIYPSESILESKLKLLNLISLHSVQTARDFEVSIAKPLRLYRIIPRVLEKWNKQLKVVRKSSNQVAKKEAGSKIEPANRFGPS